MWCSCDIQRISHTVPSVFIVMSLFSEISRGNISLQQEQRRVVKFFVAAGVSNAEIYHRLAAMFKDDCVSCSG